VNSSLKEKLESIFTDLAVTVDGDTAFLVTAKKESILSILAYLKDLGFDHLALVSCVDWIDEGEFELVYILSSYMKNNEIYTGEEELHVILKARISREKPEFQTVTHIFENAEPYERELHELYGIGFQGHKRLVPLFLEREYKIPPFRKDFDTRKYVEKVFGSMPPVQEV
jgi:NADH-quinone oxidoreductase subunit C